MGEGRPEKEGGRERTTGQTEGSAVKPGSEGAWRRGESLRGKGRNESLMVEESKAPGDTQGSQTERCPERPRVLDRGEF